MKSLLPILLFVSFSTAAQQPNFIYDKVYDFSEGMAAVKLGDKIGYIDVTGKMVIPAIYEDYLLLDNKFYRGITITRKNNLFGLINKKGEPLTGFKYKYIRNFKNGLAKVITEQGKVGYINVAGKEVIPPVYEIIVKIGEEECNDGLVPVRKNGKIGYVDSAGKVKLPFEFSLATNFYNGLARIEENTPDGLKFGYMNTKGEKVIPVQYDGAADFEDGFALVKMGKGKSGILGDYIGGKCGVINKAGKLIIPIEYDVINKIHLSFIEVSNGDYANRKSGVFDISGKLILPVEYSTIWFLPNRIVAAKEKNKPLALFDKTGKQLTDYVINSSGYFNEKTKLFPVYQESNNQITGMGFMDLNGKLVIPYKYHQADNFVDGYAMVAINNKWGIIDEKDKVVVPLQYEAVGGSRFTGDWFSVKQNGKWTFVNKNGKFINGGQASTSNVTPAPTTNNNSAVDKEYVYAGRVGKFLLVNKGGYISPKLDSIAGGKWGLLDADKKVIIAPLYDFLEIDSAQNLVFAFQGFLYTSSKTEQRLDSTANSKIGIIGIDGKEKYPFTLRRGRTQNDKGLHIVVEDFATRKYGVLNNKAKLIIPFAYEMIYNFTDSVIAAQKNGKFGAINLRNEVLVPFEYDQVFRGQPKSGVSYEFKSASASIKIDLKGKRVVAVVDKNEINFQTAFKNATNSEDRGKALARFIDSVYNAKDTTGFTRLVNQKFRQVEKVDFFSIHEALMNTTLSSNLIQQSLLPQLSQKQRDVIRKYSGCTIDNFNRKYSQGLPELPCPPVDTPQPGQPWRE
jgi:hypothetical protein